MPKKVEHYKYYGEKGTKCRLYACVECGTKQAKDWMVIFKNPMRAYCSECIKKLERQGVVRCVGGTAR